MAQVSPSPFQGIHEVAATLWEIAPSLGAMWEIELSPSASHIMTDQIPSEMLKHFTGNLVCQECEVQLARFDGYTVWTTGRHARDCSCRS